MSRVALSRNQNRDDLYSRPAVFSRWSEDVRELTYEIRSEFDTIATYRIGHLIVRETANGPMIAIEEVFIG